MRTHCTGATKLEINTIYDAIVGNEGDWTKLVEISSHELRPQIGSSHRAEQAGSYQGCIVKQGDEIALKVFTFGPKSDTPFHTHKAGCGSTNVGEGVLYNVSFDVLLKNPISHQDTIKVTDIQIMQPGDYMADPDEKIDNRHGHAIVNPHASQSGQSVHPYHIGPGQCANDTIYIHNDDVIQFMDKLKSVPVEKVSQLEGTTFHLEHKPAVPEKSSGRRHYAGADMNWAREELRVVGRTMGYSAGVGHSR